MNPRRVQLTSKSCEWGTVYIGVLKMGSLALRIPQVELNVLS